MVGHAVAAEHGIWFEGLHGGNDSQPSATLMGPRIFFFGGGGGYSHFVPPFPRAMNA